MIRQRPNVRSKAFIGDARNDENLIIAQLHLAFLRFHNNVVTWVQVNEDRTVEDAQLFERARDLVRWHYQWLVIHEFLTRTVGADVVQEPIDQDWGVRDCAFRDPAGNMIRIFEVR